MSSIQRLMAMGILLPLVLAGCGAAQTPNRKPAFPHVDDIGILWNVEERTDTITYVLSDGRRLERRKDAYRVAYDLASGATLVVSGTDERGPFIALVGSPDGAPADCEHMLRYGGRDWGDALEVSGILWRKAPTFKSLVLIVTLGSSYPEDTIGCLNEDAQVVTLRSITPPAVSETAQASKTAR
jgi:hypothetical protein